MSRARPQISAQTPERASAAQVPSAGGHDLAGPVEVVLVEDSPEYALLVAAMLDDAAGDRFHITRFARVAEAVAYLEEHGTQCVLLDLKLPDASGLEGMRRIRAAVPDLPIVVLTGLGDEDAALATVQEGAQDYLIKGEVKGPGLSRAIRYAVERKQVELDLSHQALHDPLTGLPNRTLFLDRLAVAQARSARHPAPLAVLFLDLNGFKIVNDSLGHGAGDLVLIELGRRLTDLVRPSDTVARFGGDEFMILCADLVDEQDAVLLAERISAAVAVPMAVAGREFRMTASIGIAIAPDHGDSPEALIRNADASMYRAKERSARYEVFDERIHTRAVARLEMSVDLHHALERGEFRLLYHPQVRLDTGAVFGVEALLRWEHPTRGTLAPAEFIPFAEQSGLIVPIGLWALQQTCAQLRRWSDDGAPRVVGSVNLSARQLLEADLPKQVARALADTSVDPSQLRLEITESMVISEPAAATATLEALKALTVGISIDDFGTGYTSLDTLSRFPFDALKIDLSFIHQIGPGDRSSRLVPAILSLARALDLDVIAEGIERPEQLAQLRKLGCEYGQGYLFAHPEPEHTVRKLLDQRLTDDAAPAVAP